jgi:hypothetical protein
LSAGDIFPKLHVSGVSTKLWFSTISIVLRDDYSECEKKMKADELHMALKKCHEGWKRPLPIYRREVSGSWSLNSSKVFEKSLSLMMDHLK